MNRRDVLRLGAKTLIALPGLAILVPASFYAFAPNEGAKGKLIRVSLGPLSDLNRIPSRREFAINRTIGGSEQTHTQAVWARLDDNGKPVIFSPICPHAGCLVGWNAEKKIFQCPCHMSTFDSDGRWISGPSPSNLVQLDAEVMKGEVFITIRELS